MIYNLFFNQKDMGRIKNAIIEKQNELEEDVNTLREQLTQKELELIEHEMDHRFETMRNRLGVVERLKDENVNQFEQMTDQITSLQASFSRRDAELMKIKDKLFALEEKTVRGRSVNMVISEKKPKPKYNSVLAGLIVFVAIYVGFYNRNN